MKKILFLIIILTLALVGCTGTDADTALETSGVIEATEITIAPELGGRIVEILADEGESVSAGDILFRLDDSLLLAQRDVANATLDSVRAAKAIAQTGLDSANVHYTLALDAALTADEINRTTDWRIDAPGRFDQPAWYFTQAEQLAAAEFEVEDAEADLAAAKNALSEISLNVNGADFLEAEFNLANARAAYLVARDVYSRSQATAGREDRKDQDEKDDKKEDIDEVIDAAVDVLDDSKALLDNAEKEYKDLLTTQAARDVLKARAKLAVAQERYNTALDQVRALKTGALSPTVVAAQTAVQQSEATLQQAQTAITQAKMQLALIDTQIEKMVVSAPINGVILTRSIELGEVIQPGLAAMTVAPLDELTVTVYIPEDRYGQINLGDSATLTVDSFPDEVFEAVVTRIADKAEYTPRNVQTKEERQTTVYAVELSLINPNGKLKPGMPADVNFGK